jgi:hypothetical protein
MGLIPRGSHSGDKAVLVRKTVPTLVLASAGTQTISDFVFLKGNAIALLRYFLTVYSVQERSSQRAVSIARARLQDDCCSWDKGQIKDKGKGPTALSLVAVRRLPSCCIWQLPAERMGLDKDLQRLPQLQQGCDRARNELRNNDTRGRTRSFQSVFLPSNAAEGKTELQAAA